MTQYIDTFLINNGFDGSELAEIKYRSIIYPILIMTGLMALTFLGLAISVLL